MAAGSIFAVVTNGLVWLAPGRRLQYAFSLRGALLLCLVVAPMAAALAWFTLDSAGLALFGLVAPVLWLYGGNHVMTMIRVADHFGRLCGSAPLASIVASPWSESTGPTR